VARITRVSLYKGLPGNPVAVVRELDPLIFQAAAKDFRINTGKAALCGVWAIASAN
jgi:hypothetical protein